MRFTWSERKRSINLKEHGLDFIDAPRVFEGLTYTYEDDRFAYGEQRFVTLGLLAGVPVSVAHTEADDEIRVISFRKATAREARLFFHSAYGVCRLKLELPLLVSLAVSRHLMKKDERVNSIEERSVHHHVLL